MTDAMILTIFFISAVVARHERLLGYVPGTYASSVPLPFGLISVAGQQNTFLV
jgi:hypothetical protein